jgi:hypothetical protein
MALTERVLVEIDALLLDGVRPADRARVAEAFTRELSRLLTEHGLPAVDARRDTVTRPPVPLTGSPRRIGRMLARSVHETLVPDTAPAAAPAAAAGTGTGAAARSAAGTVAGTAMGTTAGETL